MKSRLVCASIVMLVVPGSAAIAADDAAGYRLLREQDPARAGRAVPEVPFGRAREAQGAAAARQSRRRSARGAPRARRSCRGTSRPASSTRRSRRPTATSRCRPRRSSPRAVIADFRRWIEMGAPTRATARRQVAGAGIGRPADGRDWWSLRPLGPPGRPAGPAGPGRLGRTPIDRFILAKLAEKGLQPVARGRPPHVDPPPLLRPDRPAADAPRRSPRSWTTGRPTPTSGWSTACSPAPITASAGRGTGWTSSTSPRPTATTRTGSGPTPGPIATT